jgi:hypothetical protein
MADSSGEALLLQRYGQIEQRLQSYDRTIHNSFYLSLVYVGALVGGLIVRRIPETVRAGLLLFSALAFFGLFL